MASHTLQIQGLTKVFSTTEGPVIAVKDVDFEISGDEFFTLLGPSGCGKTTTLRMIAGLEAITEGRILFDAQDYTEYSAFQRNIGMVFQSYALFPHMNVAENTAYGLRVRGVSGAKLQDRVDPILKLLGLDTLAERYPADLSGGQQQRVSIARALVYEPGMLLLDEPLANLDAKLRVQMREEIRRTQKELGIMSIYVTHDQEEAMSVSDRLAVFDNGRLVQLGKPQEIYLEPNSLFVADFIGKANFFPAKILQRDAKGAKAELGHGGLIEPGRLSRLPDNEAGTLASTTDARAMIRPERIVLSKQKKNTIPCTVHRTQFLGTFVRYVVNSPHAMGEVIIDAPNFIDGIGEGSKAGLTLPAENTTLFVGG
ncbi:Putrescine transport ATP-binding protein PotA (TC 3.A.1.11.1) [hydrothermal vent metagenome]|uniref:Putrescine transport ATP-binding protein PotA (TC 3.A.1.11.1) n=1 Tax=hydrothermal vent metagenome TaxID=652676 RepID=A0A3B0TQG6_9ZZZZ